MLTGVTVHIWKKQRLDVTLHVLSSRKFHLVTKLQDANVRINE